MSDPNGSLCASSPNFVLPTDAEETRKFTQMTTDPSFLLSFPNSGLYGEIIAEAQGLLAEPEPDTEFFVEQATDGKFYVVPAANEWEWRAYADSAVVTEPPAFAHCLGDELPRLRFAAWYDRGLQ